MKQVLESKGSFDVKAVTSQLDKSELKRSMPFIQGLKKRIDSGEDAEQVFNRKLSFDELATLEAMIAGLKQTVVKLLSVGLVSVQPGATSGTVYLGSDGTKSGEILETLPLPAASATPGNPSFFFENM